MKILAFGKTGQVATELAKFDNVTCVGREVADLLNPQKCAELILQNDYDAVINAAAYTAVDKAESEEDIATIINGDAPAAMANAAAEKGIPFVHISTDYVFDGTGEKPWSPDDQTHPINAYGRSKLKGEIGVQESGATYGILRTSWVFSPYENNFVKTMIRLGKERDELSVVNDQIGGPTPASAIAKATMTVAQQLVSDPSKSGIYHFSGTPNCSWADFASQIFHTYKIECRINEISTKVYPTPAKRPLNSRLNCDSIFESFGIIRPNWADSLQSE